MTVASERSERSERSVGGSGSNRTVTGPVQTRVLLLNDGDNTEHILYRLQKGNVNIQNGKRFKFLNSYFFLIFRLEASVPSRAIVARQKDSPVREPPGSG
jgi:hypothetical protein